jgi:hypothetical protein
MVKSRTLFSHAGWEAIRNLRNCGVRSAIVCAFFLEIAYEDTKDDILLPNLVHFIVLEREKWERLVGFMNILGGPWTLGIIRRCRKRHCADAENVSRTG